MTPVVYRDSAKKSFLEIEDYFRSHSEAAYNNAMKDISEMIDVLRVFPTCGKRLSENRRRIATTRYKFVISYLFRDDLVEILGIHRYQNR